MTTQEATWGDFNALASFRLEYALAALAVAEGRSTPGQHSARSEALADICRLLHQYTGRFGQLAHDPLGITEDDVARLHGNLDTLGRDLWREGRYALPEPDPVATYLTEGARFLAIGSDLLATHHGPDGRPRSPYAAYLDSPVVARRVIAETAELGAAAGRVAVRIGQLCPPDRRVIRSHLVARRLAEPALLIEKAAIGIQRQLRTPRPVVPAPGLIHLEAAAASPPPPVRSAEPQNEALPAVRCGLEWLAAHTARQATETLPDTTVGELSIIADRMTVAHLFTGRLLGHTRELVAADHPGASEALAAAAEALRKAARAWQQAAAGWKNGLRSAPEAAHARGAREAEFALVRIGRTLFSAGWTPHDGGRRQPRPPGEIVAAQADAIRLLAAAHTVSSTSQILAEHTPRIAAAMVERGIVLSSDPVHNPRGSTPADQFKDGWTRWYPAHPEQISQVTASYNLARTASATAQVAVAHAAEAARHPLNRAVLEADRRGVLGVTGEPARDAQRVNAAAARARSATVRPHAVEPARLPRYRAAEMAREVAALNPRKKTR